MTIFVIWQLIVTLDSIRNSCDVFCYLLIGLIGLPASSSSCLLFDSDLNLFFFCFYSEVSWQVLNTVRSSKKANIEWETCKGLRDILKYIFSPKTWFSLYLLLGFADIISSSNRSLLFDFDLNRFFFSFCDPVSWLDLNKMNNVLPIYKVRSSWNTNYENMDVRIERYIV